MKMKYYILLFAAMLLGIVSCTQEELPVAEQNLTIVNDLIASAGHESVVLQWDGPADNEIDGFVVTWSPDGESVSLSSDQISYTATGLSNGLVYEFTVQADYGDRGLSGVQAVDVTPQDELNFVALPGSESVILKWATPQRDDINEYQLSWLPNDGNAIVSQSETSYTVTGLTNDVEYAFTMQIAYADSSLSEISTAAATPGAVTPFIISDTLVGIDESITFAFNPAYLGGDDAATYNWDFGDGNTSTEASPSHSYSNVGLFDITLDFTDANGNSHTGTGVVYVLGAAWEISMPADVKVSSAAFSADGSTIYMGDVSGISSINPVDGTIIWTKAAASYANSPAVASSGVIYAGGSSSLYAINPDGSEFWAFDAGATVSGSVAVASDGKIIFGTEGNKVLALNTDGTKAWEYATAGAVKRQSPVIASDGTIYFQDQGFGLYALNADGSEKWTLATGGAYGFPVIADNGTIYTVNGSKLIAVNTDGTQAWEAALGDDCVGNAIVGPDGRIYLGAKDGAVYAFSPTGEQLWSNVVGTKITFGSVTLDDKGQLYVGTASGDNKFVVLNATDGSVIWEMALDGQVFASPTIKDGYAYIGTLSNAKFYKIFVNAGEIPSSGWAINRKNLQQTAQQ